MRPNPELTTLLARAKERWEAMTEQERAEQNAEQRKSWVIGELMLADETLSRAAAEERYNLAAGTTPEAGVT